jgi:hypothetical protein
MGKPGNEYRLFVRKPEGNARLLVLGACRKITLKPGLNK